MITVLSKPSCMQCDATKLTLISKGFTFSEIDMSQDAEALSLAKSLGFLQAPVIIVRNPTTGEITDKWSGFRPDKIDELS